MWEVRLHVDLLWSFRSYLEYFPQYIIVRKLQMLVRDHICMKRFRVYIHTWSLRAYINLNMKKFIYLSTSSNFLSICYLQHSHHGIVNSVVSILCLSYPVSTIYDCLVFYVQALVSPISTLFFFNLTKTLRNRW